MERATFLIEGQDIGCLNSDHLNLVLDALTDVQNERGVFDAIKKVRSFAQEASQNISLNDLLSAMKRAEVGNIDWKMIHKCLPSCEGRVDMIQADLDQFLLVGVGDLMKKAWFDMASIIWQAL